MIAQEKDFKDTIHTIQWTVKQLVGLGLPSDKAQAAEKWIKVAVGTAIDDYKSASRVDVSKLFSE